MMPKRSKSPMAAQKSASIKEGPLSGIRILDLTAIVLGPMATQMLGDYGADVIKIEPFEGDRIRGTGVSIGPGMSALFLALNRNKRSIALNLKSPEGVVVLQKLIPTVDVIIHNMRVSAIERLGFGYGSVSKMNPNIVYCAATGFDQDGPCGDRPALDDIIQAASGLVSLNSLRGNEPEYTPSLIADKTAGMAVVNAVLAALVHRGRTGKGQYVEVPMFETMVTFMMTEHLAGMTYKSFPAKAGYDRLLEGGRKPTRTVDGYMAILPYTGEHWDELFKMAGRPELIEKYQVHNTRSRSANVVELYAELRRIVLLKTTSEWMKVCERLDIPATPIYALDDLPQHPQLQAVKLFCTAKHPSQGTIAYLRPPTKFSATPASIRALAPELGEHTEIILREAGFESAEIDDLESCRAVFIRRN